MYIAKLREKLKEVCKNKVMLRNASCGHFYVYLAKLEDVDAVRKSVLELNAVQGTDVKYDGRTGSVDGKVYNWYIHCFGAEEE
jgi:hypothetical protein